MTTVVGHWELGYNAPITEVPLWNLVLREFNVTEWWMWPVSGVRNTEEQSINFHERETLGEILDEVDGVRVFAEGRNSSFVDTLDSEWLHEFTHPDDPVVYILGSVYHNPVVSHWREGDLRLTIKTERDNGVLWPHQCLLTILHDRMVKSWQ